MRAGDVRGGAGTIGYRHHGDRERGREDGDGAADQRVVLPRALKQRRGLRGVGVGHLYGGAGSGRAGCRDSGDDAGVEIGRVVRACDVGDGAGTIGYHHFPDRVGWRCDRQHAVRKRVVGRSDGDLVDGGVKHIHHHHGGARLVVDVVQGVGDRPEILPEHQDPLAARGDQGGGVDRPLCGGADQADNITLERADRPWSSVERNDFNTVQEFSWHRASWLNWVKESRRSPELSLLRSRRENEGPCYFPAAWTTAARSSATT